MNAFRWRGIAVLALLGLLPRVSAFTVTTPFQPVSGHGSVNGNGTIYPPISVMISVAPASSQYGTLQSVAINTLVTGNVSVAEYNAFSWSFNYTPWVSLQVSPYSLPQGPYVIAYGPTILLNPGQVGSFNADLTVSSNTLLTTPQQLAPFLGTSAVQLNQTAYYNGNEAWGGVGASLTFSGSVTYNYQNVPSTEVTLGLFTCTLLGLCVMDHLQRRKARGLALPL